ncbi:unnamed protein product [Closterium sp. NIES-65]|nr:unnamed protein product [Closterium sp. NIES-65]
MRHGARSSGTFSASWNLWIMVTIAVVLVFFGAWAIFSPSNSAAVEAVAEEEMEDVVGESVLLHGLGGIGGGGGGGRGGRVGAVSNPAVEALAEEEVEDVVGESEQRLEADVKVAEAIQRAKNRAKAKDVALKAETRPAASWQSKSSKPRPTSFHPLNIPSLSGCGFDSKLDFSSSSLFQPFPPSYRNLFLYSPAQFFFADLAAVEAAWDSEDAAAADPNVPAADLRTESSSSEFPPSSFLSLSLIPTSPSLSLLQFFSADLAAVEAAWDSEDAAAADPNVPAADLRTESTSSEAGSGLESQARESEEEARLDIREAATKKQESKKTEGPPPLPHRVRESLHGCRSPVPSLFRHTFLALLLNSLFFSFCNSLFSSPPFPQVWYDNVRTPGLASYKLGTKARHSLSQMPPLPSRNWPPPPPSLPLSTGVVRQRAAPGPGEASYKLGSKARHILSQMPPLPSRNCLLLPLPSPLNRCGTTTCRTPGLASYKLGSKARHSLSQICLLSPLVTASSSPLPSPPSTGVVWYDNVPHPGLASYKLGSKARCRFVWYDNVPHPGLASYKKDQNWVAMEGDKLVFPGVARSSPMAPRGVVWGLARYKKDQNWVAMEGDKLVLPGRGTQFTHGATGYINFVQKTLVPFLWYVAWAIEDHANPVLVFWAHACRGLRRRGVGQASAGDAGHGCGVASLSAYLDAFDVRVMSMAPKDEHEAQAFDVRVMSMAPKDEHEAQVRREVTFYQVRREVTSSGDLRVMSMAPKDGHGHRQVRARGWMAQAQGASSFWAIGRMVESCGEGLKPVSIPGLEAFDVRVMSMAPKDGTALGQGVLAVVGVMGTQRMPLTLQIQLALERGVLAVVGVMGTQRLPFSSNSFDAVHCARCRVPWHIDGGWGIIPNQACVHALPLSLCLPFSSNSLMLFTALDAVCHGTLMVGGGSFPIKHVCMRSLSHCAFPSPPTP